MSHLHMHPDEVIAAAGQLRRGDEELRPESEISRAETALAQMPSSAAGSAWPAAGRAIVQAFTRFRTANNAIEHKLVSSAHSYEHHERLNAQAFRSIEA